MDNAHIGLAKEMLTEPGICQERKKELLAVAREVMATDHKTYIYHLPLPSREQVYVRYPLEHAEGGALYAAHEQVREILSRPRDHLPEDVRRDIAARVPGVLPQAMVG